MIKGYLALILHAHLPYVRHKNIGELAEDWYYEACTESYLPLIDMMNRLVEQNINFRLTINISPTLASMFNDKLLQRRYQNHLLKLIELCEKEVVRTTYDHQLNNLSKMYYNLFKRTYYLFHDKYQNNLINAFKRLADIGVLEIITSAATHGYLPLFLTKEAANAQVKLGVNCYRFFFNKEPHGLWLPECAFKPELDTILKDNNIKYTIISSHGLLYATPRPRYGLFAPLYTPSGVAIFGRDMESSKQVWSAEEGYPGDYNYREFYRDIGYDLDYNYIKNYLPSGIRKHTGIKYYKITGKTERKQLYDPDNARKKALEHAEDFLWKRQQQISYLNQVLDRKPIIIAPYDAELFGHWWFEGLQWLESLLRRIHNNSELKTITLSDYLKEYPKNQVAMPSESSWGYQGYHEVWLNGKNDWIYPLIHKAELKMIKLTDKFQFLTDNKSIIYRSLNQLSRELLLSQCSDWAFIMKADTMVDYAVMRTKKHISNFLKLANEIEKNKINEAFLQELEESNNIFPMIDFKIYLGKEEKTRKEG